MRRCPLTGVQLKSILKWNTYRQRISTLGDRRLSPCKTPCAETFVGETETFTVAPQLLALTRYKGQSHELGFVCHPWRALQGDTLSDPQDNVPHAGPLVTGRRALVFDFDPVADSSRTPNLENRSTARSTVVV